MKAIVRNTYGSPDVLELEQTDKPDLMRIPGAALLRLPGRSGEEKAPMVRAAINETGSRILRHFLVVEPGRVRSRPLRLR